MTAPIDVRRLELHEKLIDILGSRNVYFQPPSNVQMKYPCIVYQRSTGDTQFADNVGYKFTKRYQIILIDKNPDNNEVINKLTMLPMCTYDRHYTADNLNHDTFNLYY